MQSEPDEESLDLADEIKLKQHENTNICSKIGNYCQPEDLMNHRQLMKFQGSIY